MEEENVVADNSNTAEEEVASETTEEVTEDSIEASQEVAESVDTLKDELAKAEDLANKYRVRAERAEKKAKENTKVVSETEKPSAYSLKDTIALQNAKVHEDDVDTVLDYAKYKGISISEALKSGVIKAELAEKAEFRQTAESTNTGRSRSGSAAVSGESLLAKAQKSGEIPDKKEDLDKLLEARYLTK